MRDWFGLWLRSAVGERESGAESGEKRLAERSRSVTSAAEPQTEARRFCGIVTFLLVTSERFAKRNGRGRRGRKGRPSARAAKQSARWSRQRIHNKWCCNARIAV